VYKTAGVSDYLYTQASGTTTWPTLAEMISSGKRLVNFVDSGADASVPWYNHDTTFCDRLMQRNAKRRDPPKAGPMSVVGVRTLTLDYSFMCRLMAEYDFIFETPWLIQKGAEYPCTVDRPKDDRKQVLCVCPTLHRTKDSQWVD
jgi:hypothetical protein